MEIDMRSILVCAVLAVAAAFPVFADELVARQGNDSIHLSESPCTSQVVLNQVEPGAREAMHAASAVVGGQSFNACWRVVGSVAHVIYEDGDQGLVPLTELKAELSA
jgi:hypothetical protein